MRVTEVNEPAGGHVGLPNNPGVFATTQWTIVLAAGESASPHAEAALTRLCETYWYPLYAYVRRQGKTPHDAQDLTQGFFAQFLESQALRNVSPKRGRFRSLLLASLNHFLLNDWKRSGALKRGGGSAFCQSMGLRRRVATGSNQSMTSHRRRSSNGAGP